MLLIKPTLHASNIANHWGVCDVTTATSGKTLLKKRNILSPKTFTG